MGHQKMAENRRYHWQRVANLPPDGDLTKTRTSRNDAKQRLLHLQQGATIPKKQTVARSCQVFDSLFADARCRTHSPLFDGHKKLLVFLPRGVSEHVVVACHEHDGAHRSAHVQQGHPLQDVVLDRLKSSKL